VILLPIRWAFDISISFSVLAITIVATVFHIRFVIARPSLIKRSIPRIIATEATGIA